MMKQHLPSTSHIITAKRNSGPRNAKRVFPREYSLSTGVQFQFWQMDWTCDASKTGTYSSIKKPRPTHPFPPRSHRIMPNPLTLLLLTATVALTQGAFIISPSGPASTLAALTGPQHACLDYRGTYGSFSVHVVRDWDGCAGTVEEVPGAKFMEEEKGEGRRLVVVERADLETSDLNAARNQWREAVVRAISTRDDRISRFTNQNPIEPIPLGLASDIALVHEEPGRMLLFVPLSALDALVGWLPRETEVVPLPEFTVKPADTLPADHPIIKILRKLRYDERVADIVSKVNVTRLEEDVTYLSGERKDSPLRERTATSADALLVGNGKLDLE
ncbi:hypothetical protein BC938DRAFT_478245 [Jimgerdemannia flammicorona]|uniref:Uncharacterized protein n=1 Tax=Jimgerdemannia flammicorona TaxID=994334 RepID=A0A433P611_9FUNG|nr:hypothetical protein BC938DRAFT_478245 [Jimgerdemannia flammicorona]